MARLDIGAAALSGFGVIGRNPLAPAVWGLVRVVLTMGPLLLVLPAMLQFLDTLPELLAQEDPDWQDMMKAYMAMNVGSPLAFVGSLVAYGLVTGAVFRAVLSPADKAWFYLRFGLGEVMVVVVTIVIVVMLIFAIIPLAIVIGILTAVGGQVSEGAAAIVALLAILALVVGGVWVALRLSLAPAMSFDTRTFRLFESWRPTRGHALSLLLMAILNFIVVLMIQMVVGAIVGALMFGVMFSGPIDLATLSEDPASVLTRENIERWLPWLLGYGAVAGIASGYLLAIIDAPWAAAYKALVKDDAAEAA